MHGQQNIKKKSVVEQDRQWTVHKTVTLRCLRETIFAMESNKYRCADKSLARPGRKQARVHVRDARDFNNINASCHQVSFFPARQGAEGNSRHSDRNISLFPSWSG